MAIGPAPEGGFRRDLRRLFTTGPTGPLGDGELLARFADRRDEGAFAALVERHGPMVVRACRGVLDDPNDVHDAFQATFLVLIRRARSIRQAESVGPWLFGVARRLALRARADAARRRSRERLGAVRNRVELPPDDGLGPVVLEEIDRLPDRLKGAIVLCDLEGRSYEEAAESLGCPIGTVKSRLARGRDRLRDRLTSRGVASFAGLAANRALPPGWSAGLSRLAVLSSSTLGETAPIASLLAERMLRTMMLTHFTRIAALVAIVAGAGLGVAYLRAEIRPVSEPPPAVAALVQQPQATPEPTPSDRLVAALRKTAAEVAALPSGMPRNSAHIGLARGFLAAGVRDEARTQLGLALDGIDDFDAGDQVQLRGTAGFVVARLDGYDAGRRHFERLYADIRSWGGGKPLHSPGEEYEMIGRAALLQSEAGDNLTAVQILRDACRNLARPDDAERRKGLLTLITVGASLGDLDGALDAIEAIDDAHADWRSEAICSILPMSTETRLVTVDRLLKLVSTIPDPTLRARAGADVAVARADRDTDGALAMAKALAEADSPSEARAEIPRALVGIAEKHARRGLSIKARQIADDAFLAATALEEGPVRADRLREVAELRFTLDDTDGAIRTIDAMPPSRSRIIALAELGRTFARLGRKDEARDRFRQAIADLETIGHRPDPEEVAIYRPHLDVHDVITASLVTAGFVDEAEDFVGRVDDPTWQATARTKFLALARVDTDEARIEAALAIPDESTRRSLILSSVMARGEVRGMSTILDWAERIDSPDLRAFVLAEAAKRSKGPH